jgi:hypothetical protein
VLTTARRSNPSLKTRLKDTNHQNKDHLIKMCLRKKEYYEILKKVGFNPASYKEIANSLMENGVKEMYHALVNEEDILTLFTIPNLKIFWCCRCHLVADDNSTAHEHLHALVQYDKSHSHQAFKKRLQRSKQRLHPKTTFKKIMCADHAVGVLRYITCREGQTNDRKRDADGLVGKAHTHYSRSVYEHVLIHDPNQKKSGGCKDVWSVIMESIWKKLSDEWLEENVSGDSEYRLHHEDTCACTNGKVGKEKRRTANEKRRDFYKTDRGLEIRKMYKEKNEKKNKLIATLMELKTNSTQAKLTKETITKLMDLL